MKERRYLEIRVRVAGLFGASLKREHELEDGKAVDGEIVEGETNQIADEDRMIEHHEEVELPSSDKSSHRKKK